MSLSVAVCLVKGLRFNELRFKVKGDRREVAPERGTIAELVALGGLVRRRRGGKLLLAALEKSYKSHSKG